MLLGGMDGDSMSWDDFETPTGPAADTLLSGSSSVWAMSPLSAAADSEGTAQGVTLQQLIQQASNGKHSEQLASAMACQPLPACPAGSAAWSVAGPTATPNSLGCSLSSSFHSVPLPTVQLPQAVCSIGGFSNSSLAPAGAADAGSWSGQSRGRTSFAGEVMMMQDSRGACADSWVPMGSSLPSTGFSSTLYMQTQQLHSSNSSLLQWDDPAACGSLDTDALALMSAGLAAVSAGADAAARMVPAHAQHAPVGINSVSVNSLDDSVDSTTAGLLAQAGGMDTSLNLQQQQQLQLANYTLGFTGYSISANGTAQGACALAAPCSLGQQLPPAGVPVSAQDGVDVPVAMQAVSVRCQRTSAMAVAQLKLQQLLAVEQIQLQLQDEVMRLLPLI
jgi:hypothetical protein